MATSPSDAGRRPTAEEVAALVAAVTVLWPAPAAGAPAAPPRRPAWRFSGRWWAPDDVLRRTP